MKKGMLPLVTLFLFFIVSSTALCDDYIERPAYLVYESGCTDLTLDGYGCNYVTSGSNEGTVTAYIRIKSYVRNPGAVCFFVIVNSSSGEILYQTKRNFNIKGMGEPERCFCRTPAWDNENVTAYIGIDCYGTMMIDDFISNYVK
ncbi:MAG: hypothetical protein JW885_14500 [Deltaproteobacteria bacterium]|nr:hypothetical protein [Candidatus Zymogenaceae bacterium]